MQIDLYLHVLGNHGPKTSCMPVSSKMKFTWKGRQFYFGIQCKLNKNPYIWLYRKKLKSKNNFFI